MPNGSGNDHRLPTGTLYVVATPLGNLDDLSPRARTVLQAVAVIACEDTRRSARLLGRFAIETPTVSCHRFNESGRLQPILARLRGGDDVALISDGGTPGIADPGALLVAAAHEAGITVRPVPGPSAPAALLSASGLPSDRFVFDGFLPHRAAERRRRLRQLAVEPRTVVVLETPHRIVEALADLHAILGDRPMALGRELTKLHEQVVTGSAASIAARLGDTDVRGEITVAFAGAGPGASPGSDGGDGAQVETVRRTWRTALAREDGDRRRALRIAARELGLGRAELRRRLDEIDET